MAWLDRLNGFRKDSTPNVDPDRLTPSEAAAGPLLTVVIVFYNMRREAPRTLYTMTPQYQRGVTANQYRVIAIDNGSSKPLDPEMVRSFGDNFEYVFFKTRSMSPAAALNHGASMANSPYVMFMIDGARMLSPGILSKTLETFSAFKHPFTYTLSLHLGSKLQNVSSMEGYCQTVEDSLLESIHWQDNGYALFDISNVENFNFSFFGRVPESNCFALETGLLARKGGFDERFSTSGGGLVNLEIFQRYVEDPEVTAVSLVGEGTFHQYHGGVSTNVERKEHPLPTYLAEYRSMFGREYFAPSYVPRFWGSFSEDCKSIIPGSNFRLCLRLASQFTQAKNHIAAKAILEHLSQTDADDPDVKSTLGKLFLSSGQFDKAERAFQDAIQHDHFSRGSRYVELGSFYRARGQLDQAIAAYTAARSERGGGWLGLYYLGILYKQKGDLAQSIQAFEASIGEQGGERPQTLLELSNLYADTGRIEDSFRLTDQALALSPTSVWARVTRAKLRLRQKDEDGLRRELLLAHELVVNRQDIVSANLCSALCKRLLDLGEFQRAREVAEYGLALPDGHNNSGLLLNLGLACIQLGDVNAAEQSLLHPACGKQGPSSGFRLLQQLYVQQHDSNLARLMLKLAVLEEEPAGKSGKLTRELGQCAFSKPDIATGAYRSIVATCAGGSAGRALQRLVAESAYLSGFTEDEIHAPGQLGDKSQESGADGALDLHNVTVKGPIRVLAHCSRPAGAAATARFALEQPFCYILLQDPLKRFLSNLLRQAGSVEKALVQARLPGSRVEAMIAAQANAWSVVIGGHPAAAGAGLLLGDLPAIHETLRNAYACFGIVEKLEESLAVLRQKLPPWLRLADLPHRWRLELGNRADLDALRQGLLPEFVAMFRQYNQLDDALYASACDLLDQSGSPAAAARQPGQEAYLATAFETAPGEALNGRRADAPSAIDVVAGVPYVSAELSALTPTFQDG